MEYVFDCPFCTNQSFSIVDVEIDGVKLKGVKCNAPDCSKIIGFFKNYDNEIEEFKERLSDAESRIDDLEG